MGDIFPGVGLLHRPAGKPQALVDNDGTAGWLRPSVVFTVEDSHTDSPARLAVDRLVLSLDAVHREIHNMEAKLLCPHRQAALAYLPGDPGYPPPLEIPLDRPSG